MLRKIIHFQEKHFPTVIRELEEFRFKRDCRNAVIVAVAKVCDAIEDHHGRLQPNVHDCLEYNKNPMKFLQEAISEKHFDEKTGPNFVRFVDKGMLLDVVTKDLKRSNPSPPRVRVPRPIARGDKETRGRRSLDSISSISSSSLSRSRSRSPLHKKKSRSPGKKPSEKSAHEQKPAYVVRNPVAVKLNVASTTGRKLYRKDDPDVQYQGTFKKSSFAPLERQVLPTPKELSQQANEIAAERYKWEKFRCLVEIAVGDLEKLQKEYEKNPEKHPMYPEEWKKFWNRRYKELQNEKKDPAKHDFKPEWIEFWTRRMKELYDEDIEAKKQEIRKKLGLPEESEEKTEELKEQYVIRKEKSKSLSPIPSEDDDVIIQDSPPKPRSRSRSHKRDIVNRRSRSPLSYKRKDRSRLSPNRYSKERERRESRECRGSSRDRRRSRDRRSRDRKLSPHRHHTPPPGLMYRDPYYGTVLPHRRTPPSHYSETYEEWSARYYGNSYPRSGYPPSRPEPKEKEDDNQPLTVVSVLRLLTALEDHLGSLGPKVIDLLAKALALEKIKANSADDLLLNEDNCVIFETVKEKLKGQLIADVIEDHKIAAVKKAIKNIAAIVHLINEKSKIDASNKEEKYVSLSEASNSKPDVNNDDNIDKSEIAKKIAASLIAQGKTDITSEQLEELINTFVIMIKTQKQNTQKTLTTASYLKQFDKAGPSKILSDTMLNEPAVFKNNISSELEKELEPNKQDEIEPSETGQLESLTDSDLQTLLQNFKDLSSEEQHHLIAYLKKLESTDAARVEKLRKYVNLGVPSSDKTTKPSAKVYDIFDADDEKEKEHVPPKITNINNPKRAYDDDIEPPGISSNINKIGIKMSNFIDDPEDAKKFLESDDEDDYTFDDVVKAASKNVRVEESPPKLEQVPPPQTPRYDQDDEVSQASLKSEKSGASKSNIGLTMSLADTKNLIASLMGSLQKNVASRNNIQQESFQKIETLLQPQFPNKSQTADHSESETVTPTFSTRFDVDSVDFKNDLQQNQTIQNHMFMMQQNQQLMMQPNQLHNFPQNQESIMSNNQQSTMLPNQQSIIQNMQQSQNNFNPSQIRSSNNLPYYMQQQHDQQQFQNVQQDMNFQQFQNNPIMTQSSTNFESLNSNAFQQQVPNNMKQPFYNQNMDYSTPNSSGLIFGNIGQMNVAYPPVAQHQQQNNRGNAYSRGQQSANLKVLVKGKK